MRQIADAIGRGKSSVHRHIKAIDKRNIHPESKLWLTPEGEDWLLLLTIATVYHFGIGCGVGAGKISDFFAMIRINNQVGTSNASIQKLLKNIEKLLPVFQEQCEKTASNKSRQAVVAMDETFFGNFMILVMMDLQSGYLLLEEVADDRRFDTWLAKVTPRLDGLGIKVTHAISDRARALIKLAIAGLDCTSGADTFHAQQDISKWLAVTLGRRVSCAELALEKLQPLNNKDEICKERKNKAEGNLANSKKVQQNYREQLQGISEEIHPFSLTDNTINTADKVEKGLENRAKSIESLAKEHGIDDKNNTMQKFCNQIKALAVNVNFWWAFIQCTLQELDTDEATTLWFTEKLSPVVYWHHQKQQTQNKRSKEKYHDAWKRAVCCFNDDPMSSSISKSDLELWMDRADWMIRHFHRSSSAVEGRNGCLSQMYHNGRGFSKERLRALTVIHNYGIKHNDGSTAASRLFGETFEDPLIWLMNQINELPLPRVRRKGRMPNPLLLKHVPS